MREHTGGVRTIFRVHETDGPTRSQPFRAMVRTPRLLRPVQQVLKDDGVYVYHTKINTKPAIEGHGVASGIRTTAHGCATAAGGPTWRPSTS